MNTRFLNIYLCNSQRIQAHTEFLKQVFKLSLRAGLSIYLRKLPDVYECWRSELRALKRSAEMDLIPLRIFVLKLLLPNSQDLPRDACETSDDTDLDFSTGEGDAEVVKRCLILLTKFLFFFFLFEYTARSKIFYIRVWSNYKYGLDFMLFSTPNYHLFDKNT